MGNNDPVPQEDRLGLANVIAALRSELTEAMGQAKDQALKFEVGEINLEFHVEVDREIGAEGKIRFWVVELGADGKLSSASTQTIQVKLTPVNAAGGPVLTMDDPS